MISAAVSVGQRELASGRSPETPCLVNRIAACWRDRAAAPLTWIWPIQFGKKDAQSYGRIRPAEAAICCGQSWNMTSETPRRGKDSGSSAHQAETRFGNYPLSNHLDPVAV
jgi:hypothetical protein